MYMLNIYACQARGEFSRRVACESPSLRAGSGSPSCHARLTKPPVRASGGAAIRCAVHAWSGGGEAEIVARCVESGAELVGLAADLGEEEAALDAGHGGSGERGGVGVVAQLAAGLHAGEAVAEVRFPAFETCGDRCSRGGVALGELAGEGADRAAAARLLLDLVLDHEVEPTVDAGPGVEVVKELALPAEDGVNGDVDDGVDEVAAVIEVVVELAAAGAGACPDVVQAHTGGALLCEELGCGLEDPFARRAPLRRCGYVRIPHARNDTRFGLDSPVLSTYVWTVQSNAQSSNDQSNERRRSDERHDTRRKAERPRDPSTGVRCTDRQADGTRRRRSVSGAALRDRHRARLGWRLEPARSRAEVPQPGGGLGARRHRTHRGAQDAPARRLAPRVDRRRAG